MATELKLEFQGDLLHNEKILWTGRPGQGFRLRPSDWFLVPFSAIWLGGASTAIWTTNSSDSSPQLSVIGVAFVLFGAFFLIGRFFVDMYARSNQIYALTTQRAIIRQKNKTNSLDLLSLPSIRIDNTATINFSNFDLFDALSNIRNNGFDLWSPSTSMAGFEFLDDAQHVYKLILQAQADAQTALKNQKPFNP